MQLIKLCNYNDFNPLLNVMNIILCYFVVQFVVIKIPSSPNMHYIASLFQTYLSDLFASGKRRSVGLAPLDLVCQCLLIKEEGMSEGLLVSSPSRTDTTAASQSMKCNPLC